MGESAGDRHEAIQRGLQLLTRREGVWRPDFANLLQNDLAELAETLDIQPQDDVEVARTKIINALNRLIPTLTPRPHRQPLTVADRQEQYRQLVSVSFNLEPLGGLQADNLQERRAWLADQRQPLRIAVSTGQEDLAHALNDLASKLLDSSLAVGPQSHRNPGPVADVIDTAPREIGSSAHGAPLTRDPGAASQPLGDTAQRRHWWTRRKIAGSSTAVAGLGAVLVAASIVIWPRVTASSDTPQSALTIDLYGYSSAMSGPDSFAFPSGHPAAADFVRRANSREPFKDMANHSAEKFLQAATNEGASLMGGVIVYFGVEGQLEGEATITNIRPVLQGARQEPDTGSAFVIPEQGGGPRVLVIKLDEPRRTAREVTDNGDLGRDYFKDVERIGVRKGQKVELNVDFLAITGKYEFKVAIDYTHRGVNRTVIFGRDGTENGPPWRVTSSLCPTAQHVSQPQADFLKGKYFDEVRIATSSTGQMEDYSIKEMDPMEWHRSCF